MPRRDPGSAARGAAWPARRPPRERGARRSPGPGSRGAGGSSAYAQSTRARRAADPPASGPWHASPPMPARRRRLLAGPPLALLVVLAFAASLGGPLAGSARASVVFGIGDQRD